MNLFELFVKIGVDDQASGKLGELSGKLGNGLKTAAKIGTAAVATAAAGIAALTTAAVNSFAEYEQLAGGAQKIFDQMDYFKIAQDANNAYKELGLSANQYLVVINDVGAAFAATMGDESGYKAAKTGLKAISDYASGTGKNVDELSQKFTLITRSTSSYQSIADQFSGILPATSAGFLEQAQAAGILSDNYTKLTEVPIDEYQAAVSQMLQQGVTDLGLANNTMNEAFSTLSGSLSMAKGAWSNLVTGLADDSADLDMLIGNFVESVGAVATNLIPKIGTALSGASKLVRDLIPVIVQEIPVLIEENLPILAEAAISIVRSLADGISQNQEMLMTTAMETITYLANSLITMLPQIVALGLDLIVSLATGIAENLETLIPTIIDVVLQIVDTLTNPDTLVSLINAGIQLMLGLVTGLIDAIPKIIESIPQIIENIITALTSPDTIGSIIEAGIQLFVSLVKNLPAIIKGIVMALPEIIAAILEGLGELGGMLADLFSKAWDGIKNVFSNVGGWFKEKFQEGKENAAKAWENAKEVFGKVWDKTKEAFADVGSWFKKKFEEGKENSAKAWSNVKTVFGGIWDKIKEIFSKGADIGKNIVEGIKSGIKNAWTNLKNWFKNLFGDLIGIAKKILGIKSPSRVFRMIGQYVDEGLQEGLEDGADDVYRTVENISDGVIGAFGDDYDYGVTTSSTSIGDFGGSSSAYRYNNSQNVNVTVGIDDSANAMGLARALLPFLKIAEKEVYA